MDRSALIEAAIAALPTVDVLDMNEADRAELHRLKCLLPTRAERMQAARDRLRLKIALRRWRKQYGNV